MSAAENNRSDERTKARYDLLIRMLQAGLEECNQIITGLDKKANATLAAGTLVLGIISAGWGIILTALNASDSASSSIMEMFRPYGAIMIMAPGIAPILLSIRWSLKALKIRIMESDFSSNMVLKNEKVDNELMAGWEDQDELTTYKMMCKGYALSIQERDDIIKDMAPNIKKSQRALIWGLGLSVATFVIVSSALI